jgi:class 3 adenylate cyclase
LLESSLTTIGRLLGLCFGEAGAQIIGANISLEGKGEDFNPLIAGCKNVSIFGFCDIRGFNEVTEVLE